jgi:hypothetical protein
VNEKHDHQTPGSVREPGIDTATGRLEEHCSQCGAVIESSTGFCQACARQTGDDEPPPPDTGSGKSA